jgi:hypothetical protein
MAFERVWTLSCPTKADRSHLPFGEYAAIASKMDGASRMRLPDRRMVDLMLAIGVMVVCTAVAILMTGPVPSDF